MYRQILVAVDGSATAELALREAIALTKDQVATLRLVHVIDLGPAYVNVETIFQLDDYERALRESGRLVLDKALAGAQSAGVQAESRLLEIVTINERVADAIAAEAQRWPADLIVIGTHGRRGFRHLMLGSVAEGLVRVARQPVLLVRGQ